MSPRPLPSPAVLDKWDIAFIRLFKADSRTPDMLNAALDLWAERCLVDRNDFHMIHIAEYLANLIDRLNLTPPLATIIHEMRPDRDWYWGVPQGANESTRAVCVMAAWLRHTEVKYLPGYSAAIVLLEASELADKLRSEAIQEEQEEGAS